MEPEVERKWEVLPLTQRTSNLPEVGEEPQTQGGLIPPVLKTLLCSGVGESRESFSPPLSRILPSSLQERPLWAEAQISQLSQALILTLPPPHQGKLSLLWAPISHLLCTCLTSPKTISSPGSHFLLGLPLLSKPRP